MRVAISSMSRLTLIYTHLRPTLDYIWPRCAPHRPGRPAQSLSRPGLACWERWFGDRVVDDSFLDDWGSEVAVIPAIKFDVDVNELVKFDVGAGISVLTAQPGETRPKTVSER